MIYISLTLSFAILARTGQVSIGQAAFFGIGSYIAAIICKYIGFYPFIEFVLAGIVSGLFALILGFITLRLKGIYFSIATLSFAQTLLVFANMERKILGGATGVAVKPLFNNNISINYYFSILLTIIILIINYFIFKSKIGYASIVIRNDERVANSVGINPVKYKILAFIISAFLTGIIGAYYIHYVTFIVPDEIFSTSISVSVLAMAIFGGLFTVEGPFFGALILKIIEEYLRLKIKYGHLIIYVLILILSVLFLPEGIISVFKKMKIKKRS
jgi:branched-chain amino acid transport system permease protein